jgi:hypothetical protein
MPTKKVKAKKLTVGLPFNLGSLEFENDEAQQRAARFKHWKKMKGFYAKL